MEIRVDYENNFIRLLFKYLFILSATIVVIFKQHIIKLHKNKSDMSARRSSRRQEIDIDVSDIKYDSTCVDIIPNGLPMSIACDICKSKLDVHTKNSSKKHKRERNKHQSNRCRQYWDSKWGEDRSKYLNQGCTLKHMFTRRYLNIEQKVVIDFTSFRKRKSSLIETTNKDNNHTETDSSLPPNENQTVM